MSAARIAARLRERLPEGYRVDVEIGALPDVCVMRGLGCAVAFADSEQRRAWPSGDRLSGRGWPERVADVVADSLLGAS